MTSAGDERLRVLVVVEDDPDFRLLVRTLLVPSTVALLGRWNWWPSAHGKRQDLASAAAQLTGPSAALTPKG